MKNQIDQVRREEIEEKLRELKILQDKRKHQDELAALELKIKEELAKGNSSKALSPKSLGVEEISWWEEVPLIFWLIALICIVCGVSDMCAHRRKTLANEVELQAAERVVSNQKSALHPMTDEFSQYRRTEAPAPERKPTKIVGPEFDNTKPFVAITPLKLKKGMTKAEVLKIFTPPDSIDNDGFCLTSEFIDGRKGLVWIWGGNTKVCFDKKGKVRSQENVTAKVLDLQSW
jgi:hypothetical protein